MRILHIAHTDTLGGAAKAAYRLHQGLLSSGADSRFLVGWKRSTDPTVYAWGGRTEHRLRVYTDRVMTIIAGGKWSSSWSNNRIPRRPFHFDDGWKPDVVNLHWIWGGFARLRDLNIWKVPHVWTMHDMAAFTGGCHYAGDCDRYTGQCGKCPQISSGKILDRATRIQNERLNFSKSLKPTIVAPSRWIASVSKSSAVFSQSSVRIIPNGFDTDLLRPYGQAIARAHFGLTPSSLLVAFGAIGGTADPRKGADLLNAALEVLKIRGVRQLEILVFGGKASLETVSSGYRVVVLPYINDLTKLSQAYSSADVFVAPSRQEVGPLTLAESLACGTPGVGFKIGGVPDIIDHGVTGWIAEPYNVEELADGISWCIGNSNKASVRQCCRKAAEYRFPIRNQVDQYQELYQEVVNSIR